LRNAGRDAGGPRKEGCHWVAAGTMPLSLPTEDKPCEYLTNELIIMWR
jgi:hypothetical protein